MAKIAVATEGVPPQAIVLAQGDGWSVSDVVCTSGPHDHPFEERHPNVSIAIVAAGSFQYRSAAGSELMTPGSVLLGNTGQTFECGHPHGTGDRCLAFRYSQDHFQRLAFDAGGNRSRPEFPVLRLPPLRALSPLMARALGGVETSAGVAWEELAIQIAAQTVQLAGGVSPDPSPAPPGASARVAQAIRTIGHRSAQELSLATLAAEARLSPYHFLRTFERVTGVTPHQYILRARLRQAALRLADNRREPRQRILDIALDCGFGDLSNFNRTFRAEFGVSPRGYRSQYRH